LRLGRALLLALAGGASSCSLTLGLSDLERCANAKKDGDETDVDCGGAHCGPCHPFHACLKESDCTTGACPTATHQCACSEDTVEVSQGDRRYCIDKWEASNADYRAFLDEAPPFESQPPYCVFNESYLPMAFGADDEPVVWVDWCDAYMYCQWAGKRLCGKIGGGTNLRSDANDPKQSQWFNACSRGGVLRFPYGDAYDRDACNGEDNAAAPMHPVVVGTMAGCEGGDPGIFDMSGNIKEWEDSCSGQTGGDLCRLRGGAFDDGESALECGSADEQSRETYAKDIGIRCCAD
jgi:formylglycine-generating enzyme required for sulfatase activity